MEKPSSSPNSISKTCSLSNPSSSSFYVHTDNLPLLREKSNLGNSVSMDDDAQQHNLTFTETHTMKEKPQQFTSLDEADPAVEERPSAAKKWRIGIKNKLETKQSQTTYLPQRPRLSGARFRRIVPTPASLKHHSCFWLSKATDGVVSATSSATRTSTAQRRSLLASLCWNPAVGFNHSNAGHTRCPLNVTCVVADSFVAPLLPPASDYPTPTTHVRATQRDVCGCRLLCGTTVTSGFNLFDADHARSPTQRNVCGLASLAQSC